MLPDNQLSTIPIPADFILPLRRDYLIDREWGGVAIQDTSQGLKVVIWECFYNEETNYICIKRQDQSQIYPIIEAFNVTVVGLAFDQNMRVQLCYVEDGVVKHYWYDVNSSGMVTTTYPAAKCPCISLDDTRFRQSSNSDIIFAYQIEDQSFYRLQRERYTIERPLITDMRGELYQIGMNTGNRFQTCSRYYETPTNI